ncbi:Tautomerase [Penicillium alfredii]|uniref:L-dopachrome isomerase n=1 Tax=Penicillium alfredii TaxID=1506179 RepID=A0A9W9G9B8_9EURO|nr:Tautomerase [Penicillium alfredii]KAJ5114334.1 Tautomerase [Penicillium alfredii]
MDLSNQKRSSLPRLATNVSPGHLTQVMHPALTKIYSDTHMPPLSEHPAFRPSVFVEDKPDDENIAPTLRYAPDIKPIYIAPTCIEESPTLTRKKTMYYEDIFSARGAHNSPKERVDQDSLVVAELKTNINLKDEESKLITDLALRLAQVYLRPETSVLVVVEHDACLRFGNNTLPAYLLKIHALPCLIGPMTNLRATSLLQTFLYETLGVAPGQGVVIFNSVVEENLATNGVTARGEISRLERTEQEENPGIFKSISRSMSRRLKSSSSHSTPLSITPSLPPITSPVQAGGLQFPFAAADTEAQGPQEEDKSQGLKKRKSLKTFVQRRLSELSKGSAK